MFVGLEFLDVAAHARRFQLEDAEGLALAEHLHRLRVAVGQADEVDLFAHGVADEVDGAAEDGEVREAEEVDLQEPDLRHLLHGELGRGDARLVAAVRALQRHVVDERVARDDDAGGVGAGVAGHAFELPGGIEEAMHARVRGVDVLHLLGLFERVVEGDVEGVGHEPGDAVGVGVGHAERAANVADGGLRAERPEGDDLGHAVGAVALVGEADHLVAAVVGEVEVDVGHFAPFDVEEAFEDEAVGHGVDIGDIEHVEHERGGRGAAHAHADAGLAGEIGDLFDDEDVVREAGLLEDVEFVGEALLERGRDIGEAPVEALEAEFGEVFDARRGRRARAVRGAAGDRR